MTLPGSKTIAYSYDANGRLIGLTAWGNQHSDFHYDKVGRHVATQRPNGLLSDYAYNPAGHLRRVRHRAGSSLRGQFNYTVDGRGNRTRAYERVAQSTTVTNTLTKTDTAVTFTRGTWTDDGAYKKTTQFSGRMQIAYTGDEALLTVGVGPDHGIIDISINGRYWRRLNTYAAQPGEQVIHIPAVPTPPGATSGVIEIRNRSDRHHRSTGRVFRFKQLQVIDTTHTDTTIDYTYDALSRLQQANYNTGERVYDYNFDLAGNRIQEALSGTSVTAKTTDYTYNAANQLTNDGTHTLTYDANGNLTSDGTNTYTWDRANRMLTAPNNTSYAYDGLGNRTQQTTNRVVTDYLLDLQPGLVKVLRQSDGTATDHFIHAPRGIHAMQNNTGAWQYTTQDGLGSVRSLIDATLNVSSVQNYAPYGEPFGTVGNFDTPFAFTGEQTDANGQLYLRARYYNPSLGVFNSLDPFEGTMQRPMSLDGYSWVEGNTPNRVDPSGKQTERDCSSEALSNCNLQGSECEVICLYADQWMETARKYNNPDITNMSDEAFAAMIAAKFIFEDATRFNSTEGLLNQGLSGAGIDLVFRTVWEAIGLKGEISYGPGNIPLAQAQNAAEWWKENASCLGFDTSIFDSGIYDDDIVTQCIPSMFGFQSCTVVSTPSTRATIEMNSFDGHTSWDEWLAVTMLQAADRVRNYRSENDVSSWGNPRIVDDTENQVSAYIIALGQVAWSESDKTLYDLSEWASPGGAYDWAAAVAGVRDNTHHFWPELRSLFDGGYIEMTNQERQHLQEIGLP